MWQRKSEDLVQLSDPERAGQHIGYPQDGESEILRRVDRRRSIAL